ncbi:hypothetical protein BV22DRAFT_993783, partial [Leucogyrophana mollusca]
DGSGHEGKIEGAVVLIRAGHRPWTLRYHLGMADKHMVFEAEVVGLTLAAQLIRTECDMVFPISIYIDNQVAIRSGELLNPRPGYHLVNRFLRQTKVLAKAHNQSFDVTVRWISGRGGVAGNEEADCEAKRA